ncbi:tyrosine-type recombinase/integrase [Campylobacter sp. 7477a]|uniref:tyrosine-type recombinase/integrase n=1 Tax=Campylobacter sp. 7477a TaxID=2735741 RepID=UPI0030148762|nr:tyrosine-type recombinase/integrase [Campylobacter sp. 7477a]
MDLSVDKIKQDLASIKALKKEMDDLRGLLLDEYITQDAENVIRSEIIKLESALSKYKVQQLGEIDQDFLNSINTKKPFYSHDIINLRLKKVLKANKIQVRKLYNLRHTFASQLIAAGEDITWVSRTLGHKDTQTTLMYYTKFIKKGEDERLEKISKIGANFGANIFDSGSKADK